MRTISYTTDDIVIFGNYWEGSSDQAVILLHMMPATKESFTPLAEKLNALGLAVLAIDLRGHGESIQKIYDSTTIVVNYQEFSDQDHSRSIHDVLAARDWLTKEGFLLKNIVVGGASIGANLAIQYLSQNPECTACFALSAGLVYHGVETLSAVRVLRPSQRLLFVAARDDERAPEAVHDATELYTATTAEKSIQIYDIGGHGTDILLAQPECMNKLIHWLVPTAF